MSATMTGTEMLDTLRGQITGRSTILSCGSRHDTTGGCHMAPLSFRKRFLEQFEEKGWDKGVEKSLEMGVRQTLLRQLGLRFGPLSEDVKRRVEAISSVERLNQIAEQLLVARSLEEMGLR